MGTIRHIIDENHNVVEIHKVVVHRFKLSDVDDPALYAAGPIWEWEQSDPGQFVMKHAIAPAKWTMHHDVAHYGYQCAIIAELEKKKLSEFYLTWGNKWK